MTSPALVYSDRKALAEGRGGGEYTQKIRENIDCKRIPQADGGCFDVARC